LILDSRCASSADQTSADFVFGEKSTFRHVSRHLTAATAADAKLETAAIVVCHAFMRDCVSDTNWAGITRVQE
jgi:hypothetical protein